jgi:hypothetical protein
MKPGILDAAKARREVGPVFHRLELALRVGVAEVSPDFPKAVVGERLQMADCGCSVAGGLLQKFSAR